MKFLISLTILFSGLSAWAQPPGETLQVDLDPYVSDIDTFCGLQGKLLLIPTDTFYVINHIAVEDFRICRVSYDELHVELAKIEDINHLLIGMETDFDSLMANMHTLETNYSNSLQSSIKMAETLKTENTTLQTNLNTAKDELTEAKQKIKNERWNKLGTKMIWAAGGLVAGILIVSVID
jgi:hypothetical protein